MSIINSGRMDRRGFLKTTAAAGVAASLPFGAARAQNRGGKGRAGDFPHPGERHRVAQELDPIAGETGDRPLNRRQTEEVCGDHAGLRADDRLAIGIAVKHTCESEQCNSA